MTEIRRITRRQLFMGLAKKAREHALSVATIGLGGGGAAGIGAIVYEVAQTQDRLAELTKTVEENAIRSKRALRIARANNNAPWQDLEVPSDGSSSI
jgi:hypothetical protein